MASSDGSTSVSLMCISGIILAAYLLWQSVAHTGFKYMPPAATTILWGALLGWLSRTHDLHYLTDFFQFDSAHFFDILLPFIVVEAGYTLKKRYFFANIGKILTMAIVGTVLSIILTSLGMIYLLDSGAGGDEEEGLTLVGVIRLATAVSAVDPVTAIAAFGSLSADQDLTFTVLGESILNDAVVAAIFHALDSYTGDSAGDLVKQVGTQFVIVLLGSVLVGVGVAVLASFYFKYLRILSSSRIAEVVSLLCWYMLAYSACNALHWSGIAGGVTAGLVFSHYTKYNLSPAGASLSVPLFETISGVATIIVFISLGLAAMGPTHAFDMAFDFSLVGIVIAVRFVVVFLLFPICNLFSKHKMGVGALVMVAYAGMAGAVTAGLVVLFPARYMSAGFVLVLVSVVVKGPFLYPLLRLIGIPIGQASRPLSPFKDNFDTLHLKPLLVYGYSREKEVVRRLREDPRHSRQSSAMSTMSMGDDGSRDMSGILAGVPHVTSV
ncbi:Na+/H+ exchanger [Kipferlia bialata]|uniref:Na+/H+ exchanger n=1 Tax=Kipferlia bialata TaxID=797122 RepID=A0A9K3CUW0_9EUKA|nr:Na+/H+ exchanger [Kipferlia bialata]|eukprot:g4680.t1